MKTRAMLAATAMLVTTVNPILTTTAFAAVIVSTPPASGPGTTTVAAMEAQCDALAALHGTAWSGDLDPLSVVPTYVSGPTEVGTHSISDALPGTLEGAGTFTPGSVSILGDPYRIGGSVNMFGVQQSTGGHYSASTYDFMADFETTYSYAFNCKMSEHVITGHHSWNHDPSDAEDVRQNACDAHDNAGQFIGEDVGHCFWVTDSEGDEPRPDEAGMPIEETQTDNLQAHEDAGEGFDITDTVLIGQTVICISPTTTTQTKKGVPGTWVAKNGYTGDKCTTAWFNVAPWGAGSQDSNGTYISVPLS